MEAIIEKLNLEKADSNYYKVGFEPEMRDLEPYYYLTISGKCSPYDEVFNQAIEKLYAVAYAIKFVCKSEDMDFVVPKMEGIWWIDGGLKEQEKFAETPASEWNWKIIIRMPDFVEGDHYYRAVQTVKAKTPGLLADEEVKLELINEGRCIQVLHLGSYEAEGPTVAKIMQYAIENDLEINGYHHEIYISDPRKTPVERLRTIIRYPVK